MHVVETPKSTIDIEKNINNNGGERMNVLEDNLSGPLNPYVAVG